MNAAHSSLGSQLQSPPDIPFREAERRLGLPRGTFPFESRFVSVRGATLHYIDEGAGPTVLLLHGNPTWSFLYRRIVAALAPSYRCIAFDLAGFGLSIAPPGFTYLPQDHARLVAAALERLDVRDAALVAHDWGGSIGIGAMFADPGRITRLVLGNTWAWPVNGDPHFAWFSALFGGPIGRLGAERWALFLNVVMPSAMRRRRLTADELRAYRAPFIGRPRTGMHVFPRAIVIWPLADIAFRRQELERWRQIFPAAHVTPIPSCGHYLWEDAPDETLAALRTALAR